MATDKDVEKARIEGFDDGQRLSKVEDDLISLNSYMIGAFFDADRIGCDGLRKKIVRAVQDLTDAYQKLEKFREEYGIEEFRSLDWCERTYSKLITKYREIKRRAA